VWLRAAARSARGLITTSRSLMITKSVPASIRAGGGRGDRQQMAGLSHRCLGRDGDWVRAPA
jgi:hypothetical protein